jgi:DNA-binding MarR family transcriptional regulator
MNEEAVRRFRAQSKLLQRRLRQEVQPVHGLSRSALQVLGLVSRSPGLTPGDLADRQQMTSSNVAATLRELEAAGLVVRARDATDGRRVNVSITAAGEDVVAGYRSERDSWLGRAIQAQLTEAEFEVLMHAGDLIERLARFEPTDQERA